ncbi:MAG TPA: hypothetical protein VF624_15030 [Tepidisphaeraceae bacterium]|jgi:hypothetical protein
MADANATNTPPATGGTLTIETINAAITAALKPVTEALAAVKGDQKILADTFAALPPAKAEAETKDKKPEPVTADAVAKIVADTLAAHRKADQEAAAKQAATKAARDKVIADKLGNDADLGAFLPATDDVAALTVAAETLAAKATPKAKAPGTASDGGTPPARQPVDYSKLNASQKVQLGVDQMLAGAAK